MSSGWSKIHRKLQENPLWLSETFTRGQAWVDLILLANHKVNSFRLRGVLLTISRGQVGYSQVALSGRWRWSRGKVRRFLNELETAQQIVQHKNNVTSLISIVNYEVYQDDDTASSTADSTPNGQQTDTNKNEENEKNQTYNDNAPADMCADPNDNIKPKAGECIKQFMELYQNVKSFNPRVEYRGIQHALYEAVALSSEAKVMQSLKDFIYYVNRCNDRNYTKTPVRWLEDCQYKTDWLLRVDAFNKGKNSRADRLAFSERDEKHPSMIWEN